MTTWYTADLHLGHTNIIKFCERPFASVTEMNETLIRRWNERVHPNDTVYVLGDYALGNIMSTLDLTRRLMGRKVLIAGNHDRCFEGFRRPGFEMTNEQWVQVYFDHGFAEVHTASEPVEDEELGYVLLSHFPYVGDSHEGDRFIEHRPPIEDDGPPLLLHGHVHTSWRYRREPAPMLNVGVDMWDFAPISSAQIAAHLQAEDWVQAISDTVTPLP